MRFSCAPVPLPLYPRKYTAPMTRPPLYYTFGNHMHWVDMQWLWGYDVLPGCVDDMLALIHATGARGNVNFDAVGYEKMAVESPEHLAKLQSAVSAGLAEPVGCSYGQPYGLFHGGESNIRQLTYGVRSTRRLLGVRPASFWEEEFYFFPQLPQLLAQCGYTGACLFFQWTWHTPELPKEASSLILWEGVDGTRLPTLPRSELNVHQWPEDFDGLLEKVEKPGTGASAAFSPAIIQWLELMPSKDWMCRSEVLLPRLKELMGDPRFEVRPRTVSTLITEFLRSAPAADQIPVRRYSMDDVWHGMTLGKNADAHPRASASTESQIRAAEALAATVSLLGRPYASWDVYPTWELDEAWRELLAAQHHDNHECEGLCGFVGHHQMERARMAAAEVSGRALRLIHARQGNTEHEPITNPLGWRHTASGVDLPPFGFRIQGSADESSPSAKLTYDDQSVTLRCAGLSATFDADDGSLRRFTDGQRTLEHSLRLRMNGRTPTSTRVEIDPDDADPTVRIVHEFGTQSVTLEFSLGAHGLSIRVDMLSEEGVLPVRPEPGLNNALQIEFAADAATTLRADGPHAAAPVNPAPRGQRRKYPTGDWMTSPQWFEDIDRPFTARSFVDLCRSTSAGGVLILHDGSQQWLRQDASLRAVLTAYDPWDERRYGVPGWTTAHLRLVLHNEITDADRARLAAQWLSDLEGTLVAEHAEPVGGGTASSDDQLPPVFGPLELTGAPNVLAHAFFRESMKSGEHLPLWAGHRMARESAGACTHPFVIRLVEWNGQPAQVSLKLAGPVARAAKTNLLGEVFSDHAPHASSPNQPGWSASDTGWLTIEPTTPPEWAIIKGKPITLRGKPLEWSLVRLTMRPYEIATIYADMLLGRKQFRDLDAKREVWATIHKHPSPS